MANVAFLGLGIMGAPMARHLMKAGHRVAVWTIRRVKRRRSPMRPEEARPRLQPKRRARRNSSLSAWAIRPCRESVILGEQGVIHGAAPGTVVVDTSTVGPEFSRQGDQEIRQKKECHFWERRSPGPKTGRGKRHPDVDGGWRPRRL